MQIFPTINQSWKHESMLKMQVWHTWCMLPKNVSSSLQVFLRVIFWCILTNLSKLQALSYVTEKDFLNFVAVL